MIDFEHNIMVDIETFGNVSRSVIASIGAVKFNLKTGKTGEAFYREIDLDSCIALGLRCSGNTIKWWLQQPKVAQDFLFSGKSVSIQDGLKDFAEFCKSDDAEYNIWGNSPRFDLGILRDAYELVGSPIPWNFRKELDVRTIVALEPRIKEDQATLGIQHHALSDCLTQVAYLSDTFNRMVKLDLD